MGWSFFHDYGRSDVINYLRRSLEHGGTVVTRSTAIGNNFWAQLKKTDGRLVIAHVIIKGGTKKYPGWGYKELSHQDGIDCPVEYLKFLPETEDAQELRWRSAVQQHHLKVTQTRKAKASLKPGDEVTFNGRRYRLDQSLYRRGWEVFCFDDSSKYRMTAAQLHRAVKDAMRSAT